MSAEAVQIRDTLPQETGAIALLIARANAQRDELTLPTAANDSQVSNLQRRLNRPDSWALVAVNDDEVTGFALGYPLIEEDAPSMTADTEYLSLLMIEPSAWSQGIASRLIEVVAERARIAGRSRLTLRTREADNERARGLYAHKGFVLTGNMKDSQYGRQVEYQLDL